MATYKSLYSGVQIDAAIAQALASVQPAQIANFETTAELDSRDSANRNRANHTGLQPANTISDFDSAVTLIFQNLGGGGGGGGGGEGGLDSSAIISLIDSSYVQARQDFAYSSLIGAPNVLDSADVLAIAGGGGGGGGSGVDSAAIISLIDSSYVQLRQDFAYSSLIGAPNVLDSADVLAISGGGAGFDSAGIISLIDSSYVQLRQDFAYSSLIGAPNVLDSADVAGISSSLSGLDSNGVITLIASRSITVDGNGSTGGVTLSDGSIEVRSSGGTPAYVDYYCEVSNAHRTRVQSAPHSAYSGNADVTLPVSTGTLALVSDITETVDSAYVQSRQASASSPWVKINGTYTLSAGDKIAIRADSSYTLTLPSSPTFSDEVFIVDASGKAVSYPITLSGNGEKILASDSDFIINISRASIGLMYYGDSQGWILTRAF